MYLKILLLYIKIEVGARWIGAMILIIIIIILKNCYISINCCKILLLHWLKYLDIKNGHVEYTYEDIFKFLCGFFYCSILVSSAMK